MEYIEYWKAILSNVRERKRMVKATSSYSQHRHDLTRTQQTLLFILYLFFAPPAGILHLLSPVYTVIKGWGTTNRRIAAPTT